MFRLSILIGAVLISTNLVHAEERALNGDEITTLLLDITAVGPDTKQTFLQDALTLYMSGGRPSQGTWWVTATQYCSTWPPAAGQACYDVLVDEEHEPALLIWISVSGQRTVNKIHRHLTK